VAKFQSELYWTAVTFNSSYADLQKQFIFSADDILTDEVSTAEELEAKYRVVLKKLIAARDAALQNTRFYLSMVMTSTCMSRLV
jgi:hypothetical protein